MNSQFVGNYFKGSYHCHGLIVFLVSLKSNICAVLFSHLRYPSFTEFCMPS